MSDWNKDMEMHFERWNLKKGAKVIGRRGDFKGVIATVVRKRDAEMVVSFSMHGQKRKVIVNVSDWNKA